MAGADDRRPASRQLYGRVVILLAHLALLFWAALALLVLDIPLDHLGYGFVLGVGLYSLHWRHTYGYWPD